MLDQVREASKLPTPEIARLIRFAAGVTQAEMADELGVHRVTFARWEAGTRVPSRKSRAAWNQQLVALHSAQVRSLSPDTPVTSAGFSTRTANIVLRMLGRTCPTLAELAEISGDQLQDGRNLGRKTVIEIVAALAEAGLTLSPHDRVPAPSRG